MRISLELSVYPLDKNYSPWIRSFIDALNAYDTISIKVQPMSTLIYGDYDECMRILNIELKKMFASDQAVISHLKIMNIDLGEQ